MAEPDRTAEAVAVAATDRAVQGGKGNCRGLKGRLALPGIGRHDWVWPPYAHALCDARGVEVGLVGLVVVVAVPAAAAIGVEVAL